MKKSVLAIILLLGIIVLGSCQNLDNTPSTPGAGQTDERLFGEWENPESGMLVSFNEQTCIMYKKGQINGDIRKYMYFVNDGVIYLTPLQAGKRMTIRYRFGDGTLYLDNKKYVKVSN